MFHHLRGILTHSTPTLAVIEVNGVGYEVIISLSTHSELPSVGLSCMLLCHLSVSENAHHLFGFATEDERRLFRALIAISGIGPSKAIMILSSITPGDFITAIEAEDQNRLKKIKGLGAKTAGRLIVELKGSTALSAVGRGLPVHDRSGKSQMPGTPSDISTLAAQALQTLGVNPREATARVEAILESQPELSLEDLIRAALQ